MAAISGRKSGLAQPGPLPVQAAIHAQRGAWPQGAGRRNGRAERREMIVDMPDYRGTAFPIKVSRTPATYRLRPPAFGEHNEEIPKERR